MTSAQEDCSKDVLTPNILPLSSRSSWLVDVQVSIVWFRVSKHTIEKAFKSYSKASWIALLCPPNFQQLIMIWIKNLTLL
jgi:hypothetical protein